MDIRTLFAILVCVSVFVGLLLLLYRSRQRVYPGFDLWTWACFFLGLGYLVTALRGSVPLAFSVLAGNALLFLGATLRLDGTRRFLDLTPLPKAWYACLLLPLMVYAWFTLVHNEIAVRVFVGSFVLVAVAMAMARHLVAQAPEGNRTVYLVTAVMNLVFCATTTARALVWLRHPEHKMLDPSIINTLFFFSVAVVEIGWGMCFMMMNNERVEEDLRSSEANLREKNEELTRALAEVRTLSGLLPICAHCKMIRNDSGYWQKIESYLADHSSARFSHGICPECMRKLYPEIEDLLDEE